MKVHVISDMEGVAGIVKWQQTSGGDPMYEEGRRLYTEEINAAVRGAKAAGATEIVVVDCHGAGKDWTFNSLVPELIDPDCTWGNLYFNGDLVGEFGINCALCGHFGVPVALITGDEATCREGRELLGEKLA